MGKKPLLYAQINGQLLFGSEFSALLTHPDVSRDVDFEAIGFFSPIRDLHVDRGVIARLNRYQVRRQLDGEAHARRNNSRCRGYCPGKKTGEPAGSSSGARDGGDTLGPPDSDGTTYLTMERHNADAMVRGFTGGRARCRIPGL